MSAEPYPEDFKIEAVKQVTDRVYKVSRIAEVSQQLGVTAKSMREWLKKIWQPFQPASNAFKLAG